MENTWLEIIAHGEIRVMGGLLFILVCTLYWYLLKHVTLVLTLSVVNARGIVVKSSATMLQGPGFSFQHCRPSSN